jgi:queuosine precursor transporter
MQQHIPYHLVFLAILCATFLHLALLFQSDLVALGSSYVSFTIFVYPLTCIILDIIAEVYGYKVAKYCLWAAVIANLIFGLLATLSTKVHAPAFWIYYDTNYNVALAPIFRTVFVGIGSIIVGQFINIYALSKLRILVKGRFFALRSVGSTVVGDTFTVAIALTFNFSYRMAASHIETIIIYELLIMYACAIILSTPAALVTSYLKKCEPHYNTLNFNPFASNSRK